jgi:dTDP-3-amino-3,4,6-trideoxy-alpha-D-glucose transaminase
VVERSVLEVGANDFARQWEDVRLDALAAVERVGRSGRLILGEEVEAFEREFAGWWGVPHAVGVASGLDALEIALRCAEVPVGSRVLTTPLTAFATTLAILRAGAEPVWCDVDDSGGLDLELAAAALRSDRAIRAILPVHLYGHPLDPAGLDQIAAEHDVVLIEDCAQSAGAERGGRPTATAGVAAGVSLYPTKNLGAMGDGGVVLTADAKLAERARAMRDYGRQGPHCHAEAGLNSRLDELQAALLRSALLPRLDRSLTRRHEIASRYAEALAGTSLRPVAANEGRSAHHLFPVEATRADAAELAAALEQRGIPTGRHYPILCPDQPALAGRGVTIGSLAVARRIAERELSLPVHPYLRDEEVEAVVDACRDAAS